MEAVLIFAKSVLEFAMKNWKPILVAALCWVAYMAGEHRIQAKWDADTTKKQLADAQQTIKTMKAEASQRGKEATITNNVTVTYEGERIIHETADNSNTNHAGDFIPPAANTACVVPSGLPLVWNNQNRGIVSTPSDSADAAPSEVKLTDIATEHGREVTACHATEDKLIGLQNWVRQQYNISHPDAPLSSSGTLPATDQPSNNDQAALNGVFVTPPEIAAVTTPLH